MDNRQEMKRKAPRACHEDIGSKSTISVCGHPDRVRCPLPHVAKPGDVGFATHLASGMTTTFIVGDSGGGSGAKLGEGSTALFVSLGGQNPNPRNGSGVPTGKVQYIIFLGSRKPGAGLWPRTNQDIHDQAMDLISNTPGIG
jgi:hypothetical protein